MVKQSWNSDNNFNFQSLKINFKDNNISQLDFLEHLTAYLKRRVKRRLCSILHGYEKSYSAMISSVWKNFLPRTIYIFFFFIKTFLNYLILIWCQCINILSYTLLLLLNHLFIIYLLITKVIYLFTLIFLIAIFYFILLHITSINN